MSRDPQCYTLLSKAQTGWSSLYYYEYMQVFIPSCEVTLKRDAKPHLVYGLPVEPSFFMYLSEAMPCGKNLLHSSAFGDGIHAAVFTSHTASFMHVLPTAKYLQFYNSFNH